MSATTAIAIMAKAPRPGQVKTRLAPILNDIQLAELQRVLIHNAVQLAREVAPMNTYLCFDPPESGHAFSALLDPQIHLIAQRGDHLGQRLMAAANDIYRRTFGPLLIIGTDIPLITGQHLRHASSMLGSGFDVVIGPALDGGYYLIAMNQLELSVFDIDPTLWGGPDVLEATLAATNRSGLSVGFLAPLRDLDTPNDALELIKAPTLSPELRSLLCQTNPMSRGTHVGS